ncbi:hypothetical protein NQZ68_033848, partial [Dissostichus eleginoides]
QLSEPSQPFNGWVLAVVFLLPESSRTQTPAPAEAVEGMQRALIIHMLEYTYKNTLVPLKVKKN